MHGILIRNANESRKVRPGNKKVGFCYYYYSKEERKIHDCKGDSLKTVSRKEEEMHSNYIIKSNRNILYSDLIYISPVSLKSSPCCAFHQEGRIIPLMQCIGRERIMDRLFS